MVITDTGLDQAMLGVAGSVIEGDLIGADPELG